MLFDGQMHSNSVKQPKLTSSHLTSTSPCPISIVRPAFSPGHLHPSPITVNRKTRCIKFLRRYSPSSPIYTRFALSPRVTCQESRRLWRIERFDLIKSPLKLFFEENIGKQRVETVQVVGYFVKFIKQTQHVSMCERGGRGKRGEEGARQKSTRRVKWQTWKYQRAIDRQCRATGGQRRMRRTKGDGGGGKRSTCLSSS